MPLQTGSRHLYTFTQTLQQQTKCEISNSNCVSLWFFFSEAAYSVLKRFVTSQFGNLHDFGKGHTAIDYSAKMFTGFYLNRK